MRRNRGTTTDADIARDAGHAIDRAVNVPSGAVSLEGRVNTWGERPQAEHLAWSAPGVTSVDNRLKIEH